MSERRLVARAAPAADHDFMAGAALGLGPGLRAARTVGRAEAFGDDAFEMHAAGGLQHGIARPRKMVDIANVFGSRLLWPAAP